MNNWAQELNVRQWIVVGFSDSDFFKMNCQKQIYIPYSKNYSNPFNARVNDKNLVRSIFTEYKIPWWPFNQTLLALLSHSTIYFSSFIKWNLFWWALSLLLLGIEKYHNINSFNKQVLPHHGTITILLLFLYSWVRIAQYYLLLKWKGLTTECRPRLSNGIQKTLNSKMWRAEQNTNLWYSNSFNITRPVF